VDQKGRLLGLVTILPSKKRSIFEFPRGIRAGNVLHDILERLDFTKGDSEETQNLIRDRLGEHGFDDGWVDTIDGLVQDLLAVPLETLDGPLYLSQLTARSRLHETEFSFPIESLTSGRLKEIIKVHAATEWRGDFLQKLEELDFSAIRGWLKGFIDLVLQHGARFYLIDWKSNYLGSQIEAYRNSGLQEVIQENFYFLQYDLYTLALHRYLRLRIPNYQYESHFGGIFYIFLRGIHPRGNTEYGIFRDRPSKSLIHALDLYFSGTESARDS
jgi:exodeoxyribonuclease V beta subunit